MKSSEHLTGCLNLVFIFALGILVQVDLTPLLDYFSTGCYFASLAALVPQPPLVFFRFPGPQASPPSFSRLL